MGEWTFFPYHSDPSWVRVTDSLIFSVGRLVVMGTRVPNSDAPYEQATLLSGLGQLVWSMQSVKVIRRSNEPSTDQCK